jgi:hypothetical protein
MPFSVVEAVAGRARIERIDWKGSGLWRELEGIGEGRLAVSQGGPGSSGHEGEMVWGNESVATV